MHLLLLRGHLPWLHSRWRPHSSLNASPKFLTCSWTSRKATKSSEEDNTHEQINHHLREVLPFKGNVSCVQVCGDDWRGESLGCVLLGRLHGCQEGGGIPGRQDQRLGVNHLLLMVHLHHHCTVVWGQEQTTEDLKPSSRKDSNYQVLVARDAVLKHTHTSAFKDIAASAFQPGHVFKAQEGGVHTQARSTLPHTVNITWTHLGHQRHWGRYKSRDGGNQAGRGWGM